jgi:hypothetical protein
MSDCRSNKFGAEDLGVNELASLSDAERKLAKVRELAEKARIFWTPQPHRLGVPAEPHVRACGDAPMRNVSAPCAPGPSASRMTILCTIQGAAVANGARSMCR